MSLSNLQAQELGPQSWKSIVFPLVTTFVYLYLFFFCPSFYLTSFSSDQSLRFLPVPSNKVVPRGKEWSSVLSAQALDYTRWAQIPAPPRTRFLAVDKCGRQGSIGNRWVSQRREFEEYFITGSYTKAWAGCG